MTGESIDLPNTRKRIAQIALDAIALLPNMRPILNMIMAGLLCQMYARHARELSDRARRNISHLSLRDGRERTTKQQGNDDDGDQIYFVLSTHLSCR